MKRYRTLQRYSIVFILKLYKTSPSYYSDSYYQNDEIKSPTYEDLNYYQYDNSPQDVSPTEDYQDYGHPDFSIALDNMAIGEGSEDPLLEDHCSAKCSTPGYTKSVVNSQNTPKLTFLNDCECCMQISYEEQVKSILYSQSYYQYLVLNNPNGNAGYRIPCIPENLVSQIPKEFGVTGFLVLNTEIKTIPENLFTDPANFVISKNFQIISIKQNQDLKELKVKIHDMSTLYGVYIEENKRLKTISGDIFQNLPQLEELRITKSSIEVIPSDIFQNLPKLKYLYLNGNKIKSIEVDTFRYIQTPVLKFLSISENDLIELDTEIFEGMDGLEELFISKMGSLSKVKGNHLPRLESLISLDMTDTDLKKETLPKLFFSKLTHKVTVWWAGIDTWAMSYRCFQKY